LVLVLRVAEEAGALLLLQRLLRAAAKEASARRLVLRSSVPSATAAAEDTSALRCVLDACVAEEGGHLDGLLDAAKLVEEVTADVSISQPSTQIKRSVSKCR
jgi:hypothetical protein